MQIDIAAISLDKQNFRHLHVETEREALHALLKDEKEHKISDLAEDIVKVGCLDPSTSLIVMKDPHHEGLYIALEGNRRIAALKTLINPELAIGTPSYDLFKQLSKPFIELNLRTVPCVVMTPERASIWIKRKHHKGMGGRGVLQWNAVGRARSDAAEGKHTRWLTVLNFLSEQGHDIGIFEHRIAGKTTTIDRVFSSKYMRTELGVNFPRKDNSDQRIWLNSGDSRAIENLLIAMLEKMAAADFVETTVSTAEQQREFIRNFLPLLPSEPTAAATDSGISVQPHHSERSEQIPVEKATRRDSTVSTRRIDRKRTRTVLAAAGLRIENQTLRRFYQELRSLEVIDKPYVCSAVIRIFLEKACLIYLEAKKLPPPDTREDASWMQVDIKLRTKVQAVLNDLYRDSLIRTGAPNRASRWT